MPVPKRKRSRSRRDKRFANKGIKARAFGSCNNCDEIVQSHAVCQGCGFYKGRKVITTKNERSVVRGQARQEQQAKMATRAPQDYQSNEPIDTKAE